MEEIEPNLPKRPHPTHKYIWVSLDGRVFSAYRGPKCYRFPVSEIGRRPKENGHRTVCVKVSGKHKEVTVARIVW